MSRRYKKQRKIIILSAIFILFIMTIGYAAFQTNLSLNAKGTIIKESDPQCFTVTDNGDGTGTITDYDLTCGTKVIIPDTINNLTITHIADYEETTAPVFNQKYINYLKLPANLISIGSRSFYGIRATTLKMPAPLKTIKSRAFQYSSLKQVTLNEGLQTIDWGAFEGSQLESFHIPSTVTSIGGSVINENKIVGDEAFVYNRNADSTIDYTHLISYGGILTNLTIKDGVTHIQSYALSNKYVVNLNIPDTVLYIGSSAIGNAANLETVNIGSGITTINSKAFGNVPKLKEININRKENAIEGAPWGATNVTINWTGTN